MKKYCFDIDGTICSQEKDYNNAKPYVDRIEIINGLFEDGNEITLFTARGTVTKIDWEKVTINQLKKWNVKYHRLLFGKPDADFYVDDKAVRKRDNNFWHRRTLNTDVNKDIRSFPAVAAHHTWS